MSTDGGEDPVEEKVEKAVKKKKTVKGKKDNVPVEEEKKLDMGTAEDMSDSEGRTHTKPDNAWDEEPSDHGIPEHQKAPIEDLKKTKQKKKGKKAKEDPAPPVEEEQPVSKPKKGKKKKKEAATHPQKVEAQDDEAYFKSEKSDEGKSKDELFDEEAAEILTRDKSRKPKVLYSDKSESSIESLMEDTPSNYNIPNGRFDEVSRGLKSAFYRGV